MTVNSTTRKTSPFVGNNLTTQLPFAFMVFTAADILVTKAVTATGVESKLTLNTDYTVTLNSNQATNPGGTVFLTSALAIGTTSVVSSQVQELQKTDITNGGGFYPDVIEAALDKQMIISQQLSEQIDRCAKLPITNPAAADALTADLVRLASSADNIDAVANSIGNVNTAAANMPAIIAAPMQASIATTKAAESLSSANSASSSAATATAKASEASSSATSASALLASFRSIMLGAFANDAAAAAFASANGIALVDGVMYENTTGTPNKFRIYNGTIWDDYDSSAQVSQLAAALSAANAAVSEANALSYKNSAQTSKTGADSAAATATAQATIATTKAGEANTSAAAAANSASAAAATKAQVDASLAYVSSITSYKLSVLKNGGSTSQIVQINGSTLPVGNRGGSTINVSLTS